MGSLKKMVNIVEGTLPPFYRPNDGDIIVLTDEITEGTINNRPVFRITIYKLDDKGKGEKMVWTITKRETVTKASKLGQLVEIEEKFGTLKGVIVKVIKFGEGRNVRYKLDVIKRLKDKEFEKLAKK